MARFWNKSQRLYFRMAGVRDTNKRLKKVSKKDTRKFVRKL